MTPRASHEAPWTRGGQRLPIAHFPGDRLKRVTAGFPIDFSSGGAGAGP